MKTLGQLLSKLSHMPASTPLDEAAAKAGVIIKMVPPPKPKAKPAPVSEEIAEWGAGA